MVRFLQLHADTDFVYTDYWAHYLETDLKQLRKLPDIHKLPKENCVGACFLYTRRVYNEIGLYNPNFRLVEDYDYWLRIYKRFKMFHFPKPLYIYGEHPKSLKSTKQQEIQLYAALLKYQAGYLSFSGLQDFFYWSSRFPKTASDASSCLKQYLNLSRISRSLCLTCLFSANSMLALRSLRLFSRKVVAAIKYPVYYFYYSFCFKRSCSSLTADQKKISILCVVDKLVLGGSNKVVYNIAEGMDKERFNFYLLTNKPHADQWVSYQKAYSSIFKNALFQLGNSSRLTYLYYRDLITLFNVKIVLGTNNESLYKLLPRLKAANPSVKFVDIIHAEGYPPLQLLIKTAPYIDRRICISNRLKNTLSAAYMKDHKTDKYSGFLRVIHNGINLENFTPQRFTNSTFRSQYFISKDSQVISFVGRLSREKIQRFFLK
jgi:hypothetical protein